MFVALLLAAIVLFRPQGILAEETRVSRHAHAAPRGDRREASAGPEGDSQRSS
jgi:hypothetical protein